MGKVSRAIAALLLGTQVAISTPLHPRLNTNELAQRNTSATAGDNVISVFIVEFANENETLSSFYASLEANGVHAKHRMDLSFRLFKGCSFQVTGSSANSTVSDSRSFLSKLQAVPQIGKVWPSEIIRRSPRPEDVTASAQNTRVKRQTQQEDTFSPHVMTQVDKLHNEGITGKGFRISVVDSGVDWTHEALGGCFGPGCLIEAGYDFIGDNYVPGSTLPQPDSDPMDNCVGHGTHVAGIIVAQSKGNKYGFTGSAPGAKLGMYRMWGCPGQSTNEIEFAAFARAVEEGADIISYSNGEESGWSQNFRAILVSRIVDSGIPVVVSEGNAGGKGLFYASTPATAVSATGAGAVTNSMFPTFLQQGSYKVGANSTDNSTTDFGLLMGTPPFAAETTLPLWYASNACSPLPDDTPDLKNRIVLVEFLDAKATGCYPQDQGTNIAAKGGRFMVYYEKTNSTMRDDPFVFSDGIEGVARVVPYHAERWISLLSQDTTVTVTMPANGSATHLEQLENNDNGGYVSGLLSTWGPSWELNMTPQLVAPGENILGTWPTAMGSYRVLTGTSMSSPLIAGVYALLGQVYGKIDEKRFRRMLTHTAKPLAWQDGKTVHPDILAPVPQQGAGIVQAWNAAHTTIELDVDSLMLNDTEHFVGTHTFSISNTGSTDEVLKMGHRKAVTMYTMRPNTDNLNLGGFPNAIVDSYASIAFSSDSITIPAGKSAEVTVTITPPTGVNATLLAVYSGFIGLGDKLTLPYMGVVGNMRDVPVIRSDNTFLAQGYGPVAANTTYTIPRPDPANPPATDSGSEQNDPNVYISPIVGMSLVHIDVLQGNVVLGELAGWPRMHLGRDEARGWFNGLLADGTVLDAGVYKMRVRALRIFGDEKRKEDWDVIETVEFGIKY
ncbi:peptidase [Pyrenophora tritici-repentis]|nr:peptidase [Pyrenophora tritici-repentis]